MDWGQQHQFATVTNNNIPKTNSETSTKPKIKVGQPLFYISVKYFLTLQWWQLCHSSFLWFIFFYINSIHTKNVKHHKHSNLTNFHQNFSPQEARYWCDRCMRPFMTWYDFRMTKSPQWEGLVCTTFCHGFLVFRVVNIKYNEIKNKE